MDKSVRKIVQIASVPSDTTLSQVLALCNDGTLWRAMIRAGGYPTVWEELAPIPQPK